jgi:hypothetical protein
VVEEGRRRIERVGEVRVFAALPGTAAHSAESSGGIAEQPWQLGDLGDVVAGSGP